MNEIIKRLKETRENSDMSRNELSKILDVSSSSIARWESGSTPSLLNKMNIVKNFLVEDQKNWAKRLLKKKMKILS